MFGYNDGTIIFFGDFMERAILHCDLNNFYASVETVVSPELRGKAIAICGRTEDRHGIVLAKSEAAKKCGVKTGDIIWQAKGKCPELFGFSSSIFRIYQIFTCGKINIRQIHRYDRAVRY